MLCSTTSHNLLCHISELLLAKRQTLGVAESCTGGLLGACCTSLPGSSLWFNGGTIVYQNHLKEKLLGVSSEILEHDGAVSTPCVSALLLGTLQTICCDWAVAISGIAGPSGGTKDKPVGLVYIGVRGPSIETVEECFFSGNRDEIRSQAVERALILLQKALLFSKG